MKSSIKKLITSVFAVTLALMVTGCSLFLSDKGDLPDSKDLSGAITFATSSITNETSLQESANLVKRSVVKIAMVQNGSVVSRGSGVIVDIKNDYRQENEYYIITAHHVIDTPMDIKVYIPDENSRNDGDSNYNTDYVFSGTIGGEVKQGQQISLIGGDKNTDVAVLKLDVGTRDVQIVESLIPGADEKVSYAQEVFAIGNPSGDLPMTFLNGYISYLDREVNIADVGYLTLIQHNCLITHGSSGGGLFNLKGQLIGITNAGSDEYTGMNYAVPFYGETGFVQIVSQLMATHFENPDNYGYVSGRWSLGIVIEASASSVQGSFVRIKSINEDGHCTALKNGDYIVKMSYNSNNYPRNFNISTIDSFARAMMNARHDLKLGDSLTLTYYRPDRYGLTYTAGTLNITLTKQLIFCDTGK